MQIIAIANQKGGCGKTTTAVNTAAALAMLGNKVILIDLDPQGHATLGLGYDPDSLGKTVYDLLLNPDISITDVMIKTANKDLKLVPSNILLSGVEFKLASYVGREHTLFTKLKDTNEPYDICVIDCSPSLNLLTVNALVASTEVVIPVQTQYYSLEGLKQLLETIDIVKTRFNTRLKIFGVLLTIADANTNISKQIQEQMRDFFGELVFETVIHRNVKLAEAPSAGEPVFVYAPKSKGAMEYENLAKEIIQRNQNSKSVLSLQTVEQNTC